MPRKSVLLAAAAVFAAAVPALSATIATPSPPAGWPQKGSDLQPEADIRFGILPNGMLYAVMHNATPPKQVSLRLRIDAGSFEEKEDQRGLAHFIEHMVLNGTKHVPEDEFRKILEREGLKFGPDTNASTEFDQTVFKLDVPEASEKSLDTAVFLLREVADEATFDSAAIDRERGVVLSEERTRATPGYRILTDQLGYFFKGDLLPNRLPIGLTDVLKTAPRERFVDFYDHYYRPDRAVFIAVGDFDPASMEQKITSRFGDWKGNGPNGSDPIAPVVASRSLEGHVLVEPGGSSQVGITWVSQADLRPDSKAKRKEKLIQQLGLQIINRRLEKLANGANPPFIAGSAYRAEPSQRAQLVQLVAVTQPGQWKPGLAAIETMRRQVEQFGFRQSELDREVREIRAALVTAVASAATRSTPGLAEGLVGSVDDDQVFTSPETNLTLFDETVKGLTAQQVAASTKSLFAGNGPLLLLNSPVPVEGNEQALLASYKEAHAAAVADSASKDVGSWPYDSFGSPGQVAERHELPGLDTTTVRFANGVRLTVRPSSLKKNEILVSVRIGEGQLQMPMDRANPLWAFGTAFPMGGLGKADFEDLQQILAGTIYGAGAGVDDDAFLLQGGTRPEDFERQMQVLAAYVKDPGWRGTGWDRLKAYSGSIHDQLAATPGGVFQRDASALLHSGDGRWATPSREQMAASSIADARKIVEPSLASGPVEIIVTGDISVDEAIRQTAATFGALGRRQDMPVAPAERQVKFPAAGLERRTHSGRADQGLAFIAWPTTDFYSDQRRARVLNMLGDIMRLRLIDEVREKQGTTYSPGAGHSASVEYPGYGYLAAQIEAPPEKLEGFFADAQKIAADLAATGVTQDELTRAREPFIDGIIRARAGNQWWLDQLAGVQQHPERAESIRVGIDQYRSITPAEIQKAAQQYLVNSKAWKFEVVPAGGVGSAPPKAN